MSRQHREGHRRSDGPTMLEKVMGKRVSNIELPNETGKKDPRLPDVAGAFKQAAEGLKTVKNLGKK